MTKMERESERAKERERVPRRLEKVRGFFVVSDCMMKEAAKWKLC